MFVAEGIPNDPHQELNLRRWKHWNECLSGMSPRTMGQFIENYVQRNPRLMKDRMLMVVLSAFSDLCGPQPVN
jgi:hypothetical protein